MNSGLSGTLYVKLVAGDSFNVGTVLNDQTNKMIDRMNIECDTVGSSGITIQLPTFAFLSGFLNFEIVITDTGNNAGTRNITVLPGSGNTINNQSSVVINTNKAGIHVIGATQSDWSAFFTASASGDGTVTSFSAGNLTPLFTTSVGTATTTPALTFTMSTQSANKVFAGPVSGAPATPVFRSIVQADYFITASATLDFPSTDTQLSSELTIALPGALVGDVVWLGIPAVNHPDSCYTAYVSAADVVTVRFNNYSAAPIDPDSGTFKVAIPTS